MHLDCIFLQWSPGIGDPTVMGWLTVAVYIVAAVFAFMRARDAFALSGAGAAELKAFWLGLFVLLLLMAVNKQLDLQSALTAAGRCMAAYQGWYAERAEVQIAFMLGLVVLGAGGALALLWRMRRHLRALRLVISGVVMLTLFVLLRAASFHHMDRFIHTDIFGVQMNWLFELGALAMIIAGARHPIPRYYAEDGARYANQDR